MMVDLIKLIGYTESVDTYGRVSRTETSKEVLGEVKSISQTEFYQAAASGLKPELKIKLADFYDYDGEKEVEVDTIRYSIKRTYQKGNQVELTAYGLDA